MNDSLACFLSWACRVAGVPARPSHALALALIDGYSHAATGREIGVSAHQAAKLCRQAVAVLARQEWSADEASHFEALLQRAQATESDYDHAKALLQAVRNSRDPTPRSVIYDENGRIVAGRSPLVDVDTAVRIIRAARSQREFTQTM